MLMTHYLYEILAVVLALLTLPLVVELAILTLASRLPGRDRVNSAFADADSFGRNHPRTQ